MNWKTVLTILGGVLGIICGEALKLNLKNWADLTNFVYWMGIGVQIASLLAVYAGGVNTTLPWNGVERRNGNAPKP